MADACAFQRLAAAVSLGLGLLPAHPAAAQVDLASHESLQVLGDLRLSAADGEKSWLHGGLGKSRIDGDGKDFRFTPSLAEADIVWKPRLGWDLSAVVDAQYQGDQPNAFGVSQAYLAWRPTPTSEWRYSARVGLLYPPISQEHEGGAWVVSDGITASAINSWVGEEVRTLAAEGQIKTTIAGQDFGLTAAVFDHNDTSATLLTFRGWGIGDIKATTHQLPLPPLTNFMKTKQAPVTTPVFEIDNRVGYYGRLDWAPNGFLALNAFYYDNRGDLTGVKYVQWAWLTKFYNLGAIVNLPQGLQLKTQYLNGETYMGYATPFVWVDLGYSSGYASLTKTLGEDAISGRIEHFDVSDNTWKAVDNNAEHGWALTGAYRRKVNDHISVLLEAQRISSDRPDRARFGLDPKQDQTVLQSSLRLAF